MSLAEILDTSFRILRDHFVPIVGISAILNVPVAVGQALVEAEARAGGSASMPTIGVAFALLGFWLVSPLVGAAITHLIGEVYLGREPSIADSFRVALRIFLQLIGTTFLAGLLLLGATLLLIIPGIWFVFGISVLNQVIVIERVFGMTAIRRSLELMKDNRGRAFLILLVVLGVSSAVGIAIGLMGRPLPWLSGVASGITGSVTGAFSSVAMLVLYFEIRCRREGFEIQHLARLVQAGGDASPAAAAS